MILVDLVAVVALVATALLGLAGTFAGWGYLAVGVVGAVLALVIVLSTLRLPVEVLAARPADRCTRCSGVRWRCAGPGWGPGSPICRLSPT